MKQKPTSPAAVSRTHRPMSDTKPESWTGPKAEADTHIMRLGFPVVVNSKAFDKAAPALDAAKNGPEQTTVSKLAGTPAVTGQETKADGKGKGKAPAS